MSEFNLTRRDTAKISGLLSGNRNVVNVKTQFRAQVLEMEDLNFHHNSAVLLPDYGRNAPQPGTPEQDRITGLAVLYACYKHAQNNPAQKMLIAGHTDRSGSSPYNLSLSQMRAENVLAALLGDRAGWVRLAEQKHKVQDYQQILKWIAYNWAWDCDPGQVNEDPNNDLNPETREATRKFQLRYNVEFGGSVPENGAVGAETWGAFFDTYMRELRIILGTDDAGFSNLRTALHFVDDSRRAVGCGENFPITPDRRSNYRNPIDRRVEILFFDPGEEPLLDCHPRTGTCVHTRCELYHNRDMYDIRPVPCDPLPPPSGEVARVFLKLFYKDPENTKRIFPEHFPVWIVFPDGTSESKEVEADGKLTFQVARTKRSFTLRFFDPANPTVVKYFASARASNSERFLFEPEVAAAIANHERVFKLPLQWSLADTDWEVTGAETYAKPDFTQLEDRTRNIGSEPARVEMTLDPHWQYLKFLYFDRKLKQKLSLLPIMIEGFCKAPAASNAPPDTCSNWHTEAQACQCLPWILRKKPDGTDEPKPDKDVLLSFRVLPNTFIDSSGSSRKLVTKSSGSSSPPPSSDPGLNAGDPINKDFNVPSAERLAYYDLPSLWKSSKYFARLSGGSGAAPAKVGKFEDLAADPTTNDKPLMFCLDDMILTNASLTPISWTPDAQPQNRVAIFCNTFSRSGPNSADLSAVGLYKPDGSAYIDATTLNTFNGNKLGYFTQRPTSETTRNYIADYPDWTRLVIAQGNVFDVFDKRTPDGQEVVGARAAVRWVDSAALQAPGGNFTRPAATQTGKFCIVQPFYEQRHDTWWTSSRTDDRGTGRFDLVLLRCCDIDSDNATEIGVCLSYFRLFFNFSASFTPSFNSTAVPHTLPANAAKDWVEIAIRNLVQRWNGPNGAYNSGPANVLPAASSGLKLKVLTMWFAQNLPLNIAHYELGVFRDPTPAIVRAYMGSDSGQGALDQNDNVPGGSGWFTFAHETGHAGSLGDEYLENTTPITLPGPWLSGFDSYSPGSPFDKDDDAMMRTNKKVRARYFWHVAEWLRSLQSGSVDFEVKHGPHTYTLPHHAQTPRRSYVNWPLAEEINKQRSPHGKFDVFFYPLGNDDYSVNVLPTRVKRPPSFDGIMVVVVKMKFNFDISNQTTIHNWLSQVDISIDRRFNNKYYVSGNFNGKNYNRCLLFFSPRYWANNYSKQSPQDTSPHIKVDIKASGPPEWDTGTFGLFADDYL